MYKFTEAEDWIVKIQDDGSKSASFTNRGEIGKKMWIDYQAFLEAGGVTEPEYTAEELVEKEAAEEQQALDNQNSELIGLLDDSEKHVSNDPPYPADVSKWKTSRVSWRTLLKSNKIGEIEPKPF